MPRYRKLHVKTVESLDINDMPDDFARLFWVLLPLVLCREGRGLNDAYWLRSNLFPLRKDVTPEMISESFFWFCERAMIIPYSVEGRDYFYVPSFHKYQGNTVKEAESNYPAPSSLVQSESGVSSELVQSESVTDADAICNSQYSDSDTAATADQSDTPAVAAVLEEVHELGITDPKAADLVTLYTGWGDLPKLVPRLKGWIAHYTGQDGIENPIGLAITQTEAGLDPPKARAPDNDRHRYIEGPHADIIES